MFKIFKRFIDTVIPPRPSEARVQSLTIEDLLNLQTEDGLPYRDDDVKALVWELKYRGNARAAELAGALIADELMALASDELGKLLLIPVPMHAERRRQRGHNQTELLCEAALKVLVQSKSAPEKVLGSSLYGDIHQTIFVDTFAPDLPFDYRKDILIRTVNTPTQQGLARHKRLKNVHSSMTVSDPEKVQGRVCVVVDDVSTTGATLAEAKRALRAAGARRVHLVALARS